MRCEVTFLVWYVGLQSGAVQSAAGSQQGSARARAEENVCSVGRSV